MEPTLLLALAIAPVAAAKSRHHRDTLAIAVLNGIGVVALFAGAGARMYRLVVQAQPADVRDHRAGRRASLGRTRPCSRAPRPALGKICARACSSPSPRPSPRK